MHLCRLQNSNIPIKTNETPALVPAESSYNDVPIEYSGIDSERNLATYVYAMMMQPVNLSAEGMIGEYLHSVIAETEYSSPRGEHRYMSKLFADFEKYYRDLPDNRLTASWIGESGL